VGTISYIRPQIVLSTRLHVQIRKLLYTYVANYVGTLSYIQSTTVAVRTGLRLQICSTRLHVKYVSS
jgi:hypothetical protein